MTETKIGTVTHYYAHIHVAGVAITDGELHTGDTVHVKGHTSVIGLQPLEELGLGVRIALCCSDRIRRKRRRKRGRRRGRKRLSGRQLRRARRQ